MGLILLFDTQHAKLEEYGDDTAPKNTLAC